MQVFSYIFKNGIIYFFQRKSILLMHIKVWG